MFRRSRTAPRGLHPQRWCGSTRGFCHPYVTYAYGSGQWEGGGGTCRALAHRTVAGDGGGHVPGGADMDEAGTTRPAVSPSLWKGVAVHHGGPASPWLLAANPVVSGSGTWAGVTRGRGVLARAHPPGGDARTSTSRARATVGNGGRVLAGIGASNTSGQGVGRVQNPGADLLL